MKTVKLGALAYIGKLILQRVIGTAIFFFAAGTGDVPRGIAYFGVYIAATIGAAIVLYHHDAELLNARRKVAPNTKTWDWVLLLIYVVLGFYGIYAAAGLSVRLGQAETSSAMFWAGMAIMVLTCFMAVWPVMENRNFESSARIQHDRDQRVCATGPYSLVRHPGYSNIIIWSGAMAMMFGLYTGIVGAMIAVVIVIRTYLEDTMLKKELPGYLAYSKTVRYRLFPLIW